jgi:hypothetical protein
MPQRNLHEGELGMVVSDGFFLEGGCGCVSVLGGGAGRVRDGSGGVTYRSQGESPLVDLVRHVLKSCGMSCTVHKIAPGQRELGRIGAGSGTWKEGSEFNKKEAGLTYRSEHVLGHCVYGHYCDLRHGNRKTLAAST